MTLEHKRLAIVAAMVVCSAARGQSTEPGACHLPDALSKALKYRQTIETTRLELFETELSNGTDPIEPVRHKKVIRSTTHETVIADLGDEEGVVMRSVDGMPAPIDAERAFLSWEKTGRRIERSDNPLAQARDREMGARMRFDPRTLGICASPIARELDEAVLGDTVALPVSTEYSESRDGDLARVVAKKSRSRVTYWIDPKRGFTPVRVREDQDDGSWAECRCQLKRFDGTWFPERVDYFSSRYADGTKPLSSIELQTVEINVPGHKRKLDAGDIGLEPGMDVVCLDSSLRTREIGKWDGTAVVSIDEFLAKLRRGDVREGESYLKAVREAAKTAPPPTIDIEYSGSTSVADIDDLLAAQMRAAPGKTAALWEDFVRQFIKKYALDDDQTQKALSILKECQTQAESYLAANRDRIESAKSIQRDSVLKPIERIFCDRLHPRLTKLPTRAQRDAASQPATSARRP